MSIINSHDITLYGKSKNHDIVFKPLCDEHMPLLYKWNADPEVSYWCEGNDIDLTNIEEHVHDVYGYVSQIAYCFLLEADGVPIGECWLENMNIQEVIDMYPGLDVRRIDMMIGEKDYWGKGIGTTLVAVLTEYAFREENADVIHIPSVFDYNIRSQKTFLKNGYKFIKATDVDSDRMKQEYHYAITRREYEQLKK